MEDFELDIVVGSEGSSRSIRIDLPPFTLVGATTRAGDISAPLRDRFGIVSKLNYYTDEELQKIIERTSRVLNMKINKEAAAELSKRSRKTPRIANRLFKRVRDFAQVKGLEEIDLETTMEALDRLKVDNYGLDQIDIEYLESLIYKFNGGPVGVETIASGMALGLIGSEVIGEEGNSGRKVFELAAKGDERAIKIIDKASKDIATCMSAISAIVAPDCFIIGGGCSKSSDLYFDRIRAYFKTMAHPGMRDVPILKAELEEPGVVGAAMTIRSLEQ